MQRDWFSRRWVVQEIALARKAKVYCGPDKIGWRKLAIAIELFVEVESATHRLSELMKKDDRFNVIPNWFEHISELGASLLVTETSKIFRDYKRESDYRPLGLGHLSVRGPGRRSLLSLEYLVTSLSIFDCGRPHDFVYALVAISRDAFPSPPTSITQRSKEDLVTEVMKGFVERKPFPLDYNIPYPDVARDFIEFTIQRHVDTGKDEEKALDILCRPWSQDWKPEDEQNYQQKPEAHEKKRLFGKSRPLDEQGQRKELGECLGDKIISDEAFKAKWDPWFPRKKFESLEEKPKSSKKGTTSPAPGIHLPSWVANVTRAPFDIFPHPGVEMTKMGRKNADPLVGSLDNGTATYNAAQSKTQNSKEVKFRKRASLGHYSLYVRGFRFDKVDTVEQVSQQGAIPASWLRLGEWENALRPRTPGADPVVPPDDFWRTLVADRGMHNQNPPYYYSRACRETIMKGALRSNAVDTTALIYNERNSIIAEFCRRTQCVIWNRAMIKTENGHLGLVSPSVRKGDLVCIIYGCTVPVILRKAEKLKTGRGRKDEMKDDCFETFKRCFKKCLQRRARKFEYKDKSNGHKKRMEKHLSLLKENAAAQAIVDSGDNVNNNDKLQASTWLESIKHPWQTRMAFLADKVKESKSAARAAFEQWRQDPVENRDFKEKFMMEKGTKETKWSQSRIDELVKSLSGNKCKDIKWITIWRWLQKRPDMDLFLNEEERREWLEWLGEKPAELKLTASLPGEDVTDIEKLESEIRLWEGGDFKKLLDENVESREEEAGKKQAQSTTEETETRKDNYRWDQMTSSMKLKLGKKPKNVVSDESDEESDVDSEDEEQDWGVVLGAEGKRSGPDPESDEENQGGGDDQKPTESSSESLGKKGRQGLAEKRDPFRHYTFLGEAYIHGMMEGEAVSQSFYKKKPEHLFEIR